MKLKDALAFDAENIFLNPDEFADLMDINGETMPALWGEESTPAATDVRSGTVDAWGVNVEQAVLLVPASRLPLPVPGQVLTVDGVAWNVVKARPQTGILRLELERNTA